MMTWNLSDDLRPSPRSRNALPRRAAPCAGLFGWRKDGNPPCGKADGPAPKPGPDPLDHPPG
ncbi:MAG: hypothetical protein ACREB7_20255 [Sphingopyxis sp.]|jgi:hypothetical protein|uniref:hypothetical protein n=1 Tax=Sphingopyxis sp. TaxID=1908224 RepID=UPI003D6D590E